MPRYSQPPASSQNTFIFNGPVYNFTIGTLPMQNTGISDVFNRMNVNQDADFEMHETRSVIPSEASEDSDAASTLRAQLACVQEQLRQSEATVRELAAQHPSALASQNVSATAGQNVQAGHDIAASAVHDVQTGQNITASAVQPFPATAGRPPAATVATDYLAAIAANQAEPNANPGPSDSAVAAFAGRHAGSWATLTNPEERHAAPADRIRTISWLFDQEMRVRETASEEQLNHIWLQDSSNASRQLGFFEFLFLPRSSLEFLLNQAPVLPADIIHNLDAAMDSLRLDDDARQPLKDTLLAQRAEFDRLTEALMDEIMGSQQ
jgi:hypothetical protein